MATKTRAVDWQRALILLTGTVIAVVVVTALFWAQAVFIPVALAVFLTFLLQPLVKVIQSRGLGRVPSVVLVVVLAGVAVTGLGWLVTRQVSSLLVELPSYTTNIKAKVRTLRSFGSGRSTERLENMIEEVSAELSPPADSTTEAAAASSPPPGERTYMVEQPQGTSLPTLPPQLAGVLHTLASLALALVLVLFMLLEREELRNRFIRLMGKGRITLTTKVVDEAGHRISRYLVMQAVINGGYGVVLAVVLLALGVDYALLWGFLAAILRYVPYAGAWIAAIFPLTMTLAVFDTWWQLGVLVLVFVALELIANNVLEPWLYGQSMGVSSVALIVAAAFFALLWGPLGMVLSAPLTVCLVVLGKYIPQLEFLDILLSDQPALDPDVSFYQRLLARDQDEATDLVLSLVATTAREKVYDELLIPALQTVKRDREQEELTDIDERYVLAATGEILELLDDRWGATPPSETLHEASGSVSNFSRKIRIFGCGARDEADRLGLVMLEQMLDATRWELEVMPLGLLTSELVGRVTAENVPLVCIGALPPGGLAHTRYLCKRLRAAAPGIKIIVGCWGFEADGESQLSQLRESGADMTIVSLEKTRDQIHAWYPVFTASEGALQPARTSTTNPAHAAPPAPAIDLMTAKRLLPGSV